jgi:hypothetical protein
LGRTSLFWRRLRAWLGGGGGHSWQGSEFVTTTVTPGPLSRGRSAGGVVQQGRTDRGRGSAGALTCSIVAGARIEHVRRGTSRADRGQR